MIGTAFETLSRRIGVKFSEIAIDLGERGVVHAESSTRARTLLARLALFAAGESRTAGHQHTPARIVTFGHVARRMPISVSFR